MDQSIILLTYKGKVLLMHKDFILAALGEDPWHFIFAEKKKSETSEDSIQREVKKETGINLTAIAFLSCLDSNEEKKYFYHTHLTDSDVNNIVRQEGKILGFFSPKELDGLPLSLATKLLIAKHKDLLGKVNEI